jgi:hypothetical protein
MEVPVVPSNFIRKKRKPGKSSPSLYASKARIKRLVNVMRA